MKMSVENNMLHHFTKQIYVILGPIHGFPIFSQILHTDEEFKDIAVDSETIMSLAC